MMDDMILDVIHELYDPTSLPYAFDRVVPVRSVSRYRLKKPLNVIGTNATVFVQNFTVIQVSWAMRPAVAWVADNSIQMHSVA